MFSLPVILAPQIIAWVTLFHHSGLSSNATSLETPSLTTLSKLSPSKLFIYLLFNNYSSYQYLDHLIDIFIKLFIFCFLY